MREEKVYAAIIGGGASGMACAVKAAENNPDKRIVILEKADRVGKKLLVTGNGRCNLSHIGADSGSYHGEGSKDLINILFKKYSAEAVIDFFHGLGLLTHFDHEGRVYPLSNQSSSVLDVLRLKMAELHIEEICGVDIKEIKCLAGGYGITTSNGTLLAQKLVIAVGGKSDHAGRESSAASILCMLGLRTSPLSPSLSPVRVRSELLRSLKGIRAQAEVSLIKKGQKLKTESGEVQFSDGALSGICVFNLSREANKGGCEISVNLLPDFSFNELYSEIVTRINRVKNAPVTNIFTGMFHKNIGLSILKACSIQPSALCKDISEKEIKLLVKTILDWRFTVNENSDFKKSQVTAGGVRLSEIDPESFEVRARRGLYIIGEALDIDGDCGGYNLQFAFASGMCAGDSL